MSKKIENPEEKLNEVASKDDEQILVFPKEPLEYIGLIGKALASDKFLVGKNVVHELNTQWGLHGSVQRRGDMETNKNFVQPIPYCVIAKEDTDEVFAYTRLQGSGESRLHGKTSIGAGGHMNIEDEEYWNFEHLLALGLARELEEEVIIRDSKGKEITNMYPLTKQLNVKGIIYSQDNEVDSVHLGVVTVLNLPTGYSVDVRETESLKGSFQSYEEVKNNENLESWTKIIIDKLK